MQIAISNRRHLQSSIAHHAKGVSTHKQNLRRLALGVFAVLGLAPAAFGSGLEGQQTDAVRSGDAMATVVTAANTAVTSSEQIKGEIDTFYKNSKGSPNDLAEFFRNIARISEESEKEGLIQSIWTYMSKLRPAKNLSELPDRLDTYASHIRIAYSNTFEILPAQKAELIVNRVLTNEFLEAHGAVSEIMPEMCKYSYTGVSNFLQRGVEKAETSKTRAEFESRIVDFTYTLNIEKPSQEKLRPLMKQYFDLAVKFLMAEGSTNTVLNDVVRNLAIMFVGLEEEGKTDTIDMLFKLAAEQPRDYEFHTLFDVYQSTKLTLLNRINTADDAEYRLARTYSEKEMYIKFKNLVDKVREVY